MLELLCNEKGRLRFPIRLVWNDDERRPRSPIRITVGIVLVFLFAGLGGGYRPTPLTGNGPITEAVNNLARGIPQAAGIILGVVLITVLLDRRIFTDLGIALESGVWRRFASGLILGAGITTLSVVVGALVGFYEIVGIQTTSGPVVWLLLVVVTGFSQLLTVIAEELLARGYLITNVIEGLDGMPKISRRVAAGIAVAIASIFFYFTHSARGDVFGIMAAGLAVLLGVAYVLSGDLSVPIGIHFGINLAGGLLGTQPLSVSLFQLTSNTTVAESLVLPVEAVAVRLAGAVIAIGLLLWWYRSMSKQIRVEPSIAQPTLRWRYNSDTTTKQS